MTFNEFENYRTALLKEVVATCDTKGKEYVNSESRFANFDRLAERLNIKPTAVGLIYLTKHMDAIESYISCGRSYSTETIQGRIVDSIAYLTLIGGMIQEAAQKAESKIVQECANSKIQWQCNFCEYKTTIEAVLKLHEATHVRPAKLPDKNVGSHQPMEYDPTNPYVERDPFNNL